MNKKLKIAEYTKALLDSAIKRGTKQGVLVYTSILDELIDKIDSSDIDNILNKLNNALIGIEAHGDLTNEEYLFVKKLRGLSK
jgi:hypothetical protein